MPQEIFQPGDPFYIDFPGRIRKIQAEMASRGIDVYLGSRIRTLSWTLDAFCPWRSFVVIPAEGLPTAFTFVIDAVRVADETWLDADQVTQISEFISGLFKGKGGRLGIESGMSNYLAEGNLTHYEYKAFQAALP